MNSITINQFKNNIQDLIEQVTDRHIPIKITDKNGRGFIAISAEDWEQQQETLLVLQNIIYRGYGQEEFLKKIALFTNLMINMFIFLP